MRFLAEIVQQLESQVVKQQTLPTEPSPCIDGLKIDLISMKDLRDTNQRSMTTKVPKPAEKVALTTTWAMG